MIYKQFKILLLSILVSGTCSAELIVDPMRPGGGVSSQGASTQTITTVKRQRPHLHYESVSIIGNHKVAVINGQRLSVDQSISGAKLVSIHPEYVTMLFDGQRYRINKSGQKAVITHSDNFQQGISSTP